MAVAATTPAAATPAATTSTRIGGPLLGRRIPHGRQKMELDPSSWGIMEPLITSGAEQFILLPNRHFVHVVAYGTGKLIASLVPFMGSDDEAQEEVIIESTTLAIYPMQPQNIKDVLAQDNTGDDSEIFHGSREEEVLLIGCRDGTLREFPLEWIVNNNIKSCEKSCGRYNLKGRCLGPRRVIIISPKLPIKHLAAPSLPTVGGVVVYAMIETDTEGTLAHQKLCRIVLPPYYSTNVIKSNLCDPIETVDSFKCHVGRNEKKRRYENFLPFRLLMMTKKTVRGFAADDHPDRDIVVVVARANGLRFYHEHLTVLDGILGGKRSKSVFFNTPAMLSAVTVSPNGNDIACGFWEGEMTILTNAFPAVLDYLAKLEQGEHPKHPSCTILTRRVHWHAHPVTTLSYQQSDTSDPLLYSAGEESVLVVWQLARGTSKPANTLPRLAKGGVTHILAAGESSTPGILICCEDNSLQLIQSHNLRPVWKLQGLAPCTHDTRIRGDEHSVLLSGLSGAPGYLSWFNPRSQVVDVQLEVVPFNRVSRTDDMDAPMPTPKITHTAFSEDMTQMITVETVPTENPAIGKAQFIKSGTRIGVVTTIKFWAKTPRSNKDISKPYFITALMTFPHGERHRVSAIAMSKNGEYACTVSNDERAFRLWRQTLEVDDVDSSRRRPVWICQYKVSTPSGYAKFDTPSQGVDFSSDGSTLCIAYGHTLTLWDHRAATLLNSLHHVDHEIIEQVQFVNTDLIHDSLLSRSKTGVKLQSPYGDGKANGWSSGISTDCTAIVTDVQPINGEQICITIHFPMKQMSKIVLVHTVTGEPISPASVIEVPFKVQGVAHAGPRFRQRPGFHKFGEDPVSNNNNIDEPPLSLFVMSVNGELFWIREGIANDYDLSLVSFDSRTLKKRNSVPMIHMPPPSSSEKRVFMDQDGIDVVEPPTKKAAIQAFIGEQELTPISTLELPFISGNFLSAFVGRNLAKREQDEE